MDIEITLEALDLSEAFRRAKEVFGDHLENCWWKKIELIKISLVWNPDDKPHYMFVFKGEAY